MFGTPVYIKQHGLIVSDDMIQGPMTLNASIKRTYELIRDDAMYSSAAVRVQANIEVSVFATLVIFGNRRLFTSLSAAEITNKLRDELVREYMRATADNEEAPKKKRGRKSKDEDDEDEEDEAESLQQKAIQYATDNMDSIAVDIILSKTNVVDGSPVEIRNSDPYKVMANRSEESAAKLEKTLGRVAALVRQRGDALGAMRNGAQPTGGIDSLVPSHLGGDVQQIDQAGLRKYEEGLRATVDETTDRISKIYDSFQTNVLDRAVATTNARNNFRMTEDFTIRDITVSVESAMEELFKEIVPVKALNAR